MFGGFSAEGASCRRAGNSQHGCRRAVNEAPQVLSDPGLDRAVRAALQALDEATDEAYAVLEGQPRVALAPLGRARCPDPAGLDAERADASGKAVQPARRQKGVEEPAPKGRPDHAGAEVPIY